MVLVCILLLGNCSFAASGNELVENANFLDGQIVSFEGEVVGDIMERGDHAWLNVNDGQRAIGIWTKKGQIKEIACVGSYFNKGCEIAIEGEFHQACAQHGGDLDIHAETITVLVKGHPVKHPISDWKIPLTWTLFGITLGVHLFFIYLKRRPKS